MDNKCKNNLLRYRYGPVRRHLRRSKHRWLENLPYWTLLYWSVLCLGYREARCRRNDPVNWCCHPHITILNIALNGAINHWRIVREAAKKKLEEENLNKLVIKALRKDDVDESYAILVDNADNYDDNAPRVIQEDNKYLLCSTTSHLKPMLSFIIMLNNIQKYQQWCTKETQLSIN